MTEKFTKDLMAFCEMLSVIIENVYKSERDVCFCFANNLTKEFILSPCQSIKVHSFKVGTYMF